MWCIVITKTCSLSLNLTNTALNIGPRPSSNPLLPSCLSTCLKHSSLIPSPNPPRSTSLNSTSTSLRISCTASPSIAGNTVLKLSCLRTISLIVCPSPVLFTAPSIHIDTGTLYVLFPASSTSKNHIRFCPNDSGTRASLSLLFITLLSVLLPLPCRRSISSPSSPIVACSNTFLTDSSTPNAFPTRD